MRQSLALPNVAGRSAPPELGRAGLAPVDQLVALRPRMTAVARRMLANAEEAEDVVQSAFEKALRKREQFDARARLSTWLHRIVVNEALMWLRSEGRRRRRLGSLTADPSLGPVEIHPESRRARCDRVEELRRHVARLPESERAVIEACALGERSYADYAAANGIAADAAKSRALRARRRLRDWLTCC